MGMDKNELTNNLIIGGSLVIGGFLF